METILTNDDLVALLDMVIERIRADLGDGKPLRLKEKTDETVINCTDNGIRSGDA
jgi:hypothetical protein